MNSTAIIVLQLLLSFFSIFNNNNNFIQKSKITIAVLGVETNSFNSAEKKQIIKKIEDIFSTNKKIKLIDRKEIIKILQKNGIEKPENPVCFKDIVKLKKQLKISKIVTGLASKIDDDLMLVTITITDLKTGESKNASSSCNKSFEYFLNYTIKNVVLQLLQKI